MAVYRIGVISDTHGLVRPEALAVLEGSDLIIHAGDIGKPEVLERFRQIAPLEAVRGNVDRGEWAETLPETKTLELDGTRLFLIHNLKEMALDPARERFNAVISGHSHQPLIRREEGLLFLNPGSAGPRRFKLPVCLALLTLENTRLEGRIIYLAF